MPRGPYGIEMTMGRRPIRESVSYGPEMVGGMFLYGCDHHISSMQADQSLGPHGTNVPFGSGQRDGLPSTVLSSVLSTSMRMMVSAVSSHLQLTHGLGG